jgi:hypothetical protein
MLKNIGDVVLPTRIRTRFALERIFTLDDLLACTASDVLRIPQLGRGSYKIIKHALGKSGLTLKGDTLELQEIDKAVADKALAEAAVLVLKDDLYALQVELYRNKKLLGQCIERQSNPKGGDWINQDLLDRDVRRALETAAHNSYSKIFGSLYWKKDLGI